MPSYRPKSFLTRDQRQLEGTLIIVDVEYLSKASFGNRQVGQDNPDRESLALRGHSMLHENRSGRVGIDRQEADSAFSLMLAPTPLTLAPAMAMAMAIAMGSTADPTPTML